MVANVQERRKEIKFLQNLRKSLYEVHFLVVKMMHTFRNPTQLLVILNFSSINKKYFLAYSVLGLHHIENFHTIRKKNTLHKFFLTTPNTSHCTQNTTSCHKNNKLGRRAFF